jgi:hypothetical protein
MSVSCDCCVLYSTENRQKPGQSGKRIKDKAQREKKVPVFSTCPEWHLDPPSLLYKRYRGSPGVKRPGCDLTIHPYLARG